MITSNKAIMVEISYNNHSVKLGGNTTKELASVVKNWLKQFNRTIANRVYHNVRQHGLTRVPPYLTMTAL